MPSSGFHGSCRRVSSNRALRQAAREPVVRAPVHPAFDDPLPTNAARSSLASAMTVVRSVAGAWLAFVRCAVGVAPWKPPLAAVPAPTVISQACPRGATPAPSVTSDPARQPIRTLPLGMRR